MTQIHSLELCITILKNEENSVYIYHLKPLKNYILLSILLQFSAEIIRILSRLTVRSLMSTIVDIPHR